MRRDAIRRIEALENRMLPDVPSLYLRYVATEPGAWSHLGPFDRSRLVQLEGTVNAHVDHLVAVHGPGVLRDHPVRNDALMCLSDEDLDWLEQVMSDTAMKGGACQP